MFLRSLAAILSFATAYILVPLGLRFLPFSFKTSSVVVGAPLFYDFDINRAFYFGYADLLLIPLVSSVLFYLIARRLPEGPTNDSPAALEPAAEGTKLILVRTAAIGFLLGTLFFRKGWTPVWLVGLLGAIAWSLGVRKLSTVLALRYPQRAKAWFQAAMNLAALPFVAFVPWVFSLQTAAIVDGALLEVAWFPFSWALGSFAALTFLASLLLFHWDLHSVEVSVVGEQIFPREKLLSIFVVITATLFAFDACFPINPWLAGHDFFHWGEGFIPARLLSQGKVPWRDYLFVHGLLEDALQYLPGLFQWGESLWAAWLGRTFWFHPIGIVLVGLCYWAFFHSNPWFVLSLILLLFFPVLFIGPSVTAFVPRFFLMPVCLVAGLYYFRRPTVLRAISLGGLLILSFFLSAETLFLALGFGVLTVVSDVQSWDRTRALVWNIRRSLGLAVMAVAGLGIGFYCLKEVGALDAYLDFHLRTASGHRFTGGGVGQRVEPLWLLAFFGTLAACFYSAGKALRRRRRFSAEELVAGAVFVFAVLYYQKFLSRSDSHHFLLMWMPSLFLSLYCLFRLLNVWDAMARVTTLPRVKLQRPVSALVFALVLLLLSPKIFRRLDAQAGGRLDATVSTISHHPELGPIGLGESAKKAFNDSLEFFGPNRETETVFDFTNQPLLYHYLLGFQPTTRFPFVSVAIHPYLQTEVIRELERVRPRFVIYQSKSSYYFDWDGVSNSVRHHLVSAHLLRHYQPSAWVGGNLVLERRESGGAPKLTWFDALDSVQSCNWGHVLSYWAKPYVEAPSYSVVAHQTATSSTRLSLPPSSLGKPGYLDLYFSSVGQGNIELVFEGSKPQIRFSTRPGTNVRYRIPVGSCPQWFARRTDFLNLKHGQDLVLEKAVWAVNGDPF